MTGLLSQKRKQVHVQSIWQHEEWRCLKWYEGHNGRKESPHCFEFTFIIQYIFDLKPILLNNMDKFQYSCFYYHILLCFEMILATRLNRFERVESIEYFEFHALLFNFLIISTRSLILPPSNQKIIHARNQWNFTPDRLVWLKTEGCNLCILFLLIYLQIFSNCFWTCNFPNSYLKNYICQF